MWYLEAIVRTSMSTINKPKPPFNINTANTFILMCTIASATHADHVPKDNTFVITAMIVLTRMLRLQFPTEMLF